MVKHKRTKSARQTRAIAVKRQEKEYSKTPHSFVFARADVGLLVKQLALDLRQLFEPFTASRLKVGRRNSLKDLITVAGPLRVSHFLYLTHLKADKVAAKRERQSAKRAARQAANNNASQPNVDSDQHQPGGIYLHLVRVPHGPSLTFLVQQYSLRRDLQTFIQRVFDSHQYSHPPLLAMTGFGSLLPGESNPSPPPPHLRLVVDMLQNMLPSLNIQQLKLSTVRRVLLVSREVDMASSESSTTDDVDDVIHFRHYHIRTENRELSKPLRRLCLGGAGAKKRRFGGSSGKPTGLPDLSKYLCIEDYLIKTGMLSESGLSEAASDADDEVELPQSSSSNTDLGRSAGVESTTHGLNHLGSAKRAAVRLVEIGPRMTLKLIKIESGLNTGTVLYHRWHSRTLTEVAEQSELLREREALRAARRAEHEARREANEAAREAHKQACLDGMTKSADDDEQLRQVVDENLTTNSAQTVAPKTNKKIITGVKRKVKDTKQRSNGKNHKVKRPK